MSDRPVLARVTMPNGDVHEVRSPEELSELSGMPVYAGPSYDGRTYRVGRLRPEVEAYAAYLGAQAGS